MSRLDILALVVAAAVTIRPAAAGSQGTVPVQYTEAQQLVVMIHDTLDGVATIGAGIIVGASEHQLYIVTANHVVRKGTSAATDIRVSLRSREDKPLLATLTPSFDTDRDVAVLTVDSKAAAIDLARLPFDRLGMPALLMPGDGVSALGQPQGRLWGMSPMPLPVVATNDSSLTFETSTVITPGYSGGALLNKRGEIIGLLHLVEPPEATARNMAQVLEMLRTWRLPVALRSRFDYAKLDVVSAGAGFSCGLRRDGAAFCWGDNEHGELGTGARGNNLGPVRVSTDLEFVSVSAGWSYACALTVIGIPYCWGNSQTDDENGPVPGNALERRVPRIVASDVRFASVSAGYNHACGVTSAGAAYCWGDNASGQLGNGSNRSSLTPVRVESNVALRTVSAGFMHSCALTMEGRAYCWGSGSWGALGTGDTASHARPVAVAGALHFAALSAGFLYTCAVTDKGVAYCWGNNEFGQLGNGTTTGASAPHAVASQRRFQTISTDRTNGRSVTCGVALGGDALCWGWESEALGQLVIDDDSRPGVVTGALVFRAVSVGLSHVCGVVTTGEIYCWGDDRYGQLGDGATATRITPSLVPIPR